MKKPEIKSSWLDKAVAFIDPERGMRRLRAKTALAMAGAYLGADKSRRSMQQWRTSNGDADSDMLYDLPTLRQRSRDLQRNSALASGAIHTKVTNVVGSGLKLQSSIDADFLGLTADQATAWQTQVEREFSLWAESQNCDMERTCNFYELQELAFRSTLENGDCFANLPFSALGGFPYDLRVQLIEADRISNPGFRADGEKAPTSAHKVFGGVEKNDFGQVIAYHISDQHPGVIRRDKMRWVRLEGFGNRTGRRNVLHLFRKLRVGQSRGVPDLAAVIEPLKQLDRYTEAEITAAVVSGLFAGFIKSETPDGIAPMEPLSETGATTADTDIKMASGALVSLLPGEDITFADPGRPNQAFDAFVMAVLRQIGVALELPFEILVKHFTASYSAARAALLEAWKFFTARRTWLAANFCQPIYEEWLTEAVAIGRISAPGFIDGDLAVRKAYCRAMWIGPGKGQIQPLQETKAAETRVLMGISSLQKEAMELDGSDWDVLHAQRRREKQMRVQDGLEAVISDPSDDEQDPENPESLENPDEPEKPEKH